MRQSTFLRRYRRRWSGSPRDADSRCTPIIAGVTHHLAQLNLARLRRPLDHTETAEFVAAIEPINALAEVSRGFVWRLTDDHGRSASHVSIDAIDDPLVIVNYTVWEDLESLRHYAYRSGHGSYFRRRREWFEKPTRAMNVNWWTPAGVIPGLDDAYQRLEHLRANGPSDTGWPMTEPRDPPRR